ncbi:MAG: F0F1 ATP synthase subunit A [Lachnospiraceae bacterium]|nr:F0F1 ATP synthase subunit A [Lachnospiraceae bacterium]MDD7076558.1 F0F1 ATP synthase subunit A [Lachnospiraceae bacterium]MDY3730701.1 F0F1 ATP synthase subunit A [Candidatus Choladocola sp.]
MERLAENLLEELNCETVFTIPVLGGMEVAESTVITWVIMAFIVLLSIWLTRDLKVNQISKRQAVAEFIVTWLQNFVRGMIGEEAKEYVPYLVSVLIYIALSNVIGLFGLKPPTKDLNVTVALSLMSIILIEASGIRKKGVKKWFKSFAEPVAVIAPINVLEIFIRPLSLCMRLFGNVLGAFVIMELIKQILPVGLPLPFSFYFDIFDGLIQAYVFVFLTSLFIKEAVE